MRLGSFEEMPAGLRTVYDLRKTLAEKFWVAMRLNQSASGRQEEDAVQAVYRGLPTAMKTRAAENTPHSFKFLQLLWVSTLDPLLSPGSHVSGISLELHTRVFGSIQHTRFVCAKDKGARTGSPLGGDRSLG